MPEDRKMIQVLELLQTKMEIVQLLVLLRVLLYLVALPLMQQPVRKEYLLQK